jgi:hypothetical protein
MYVHVLFVVGHPACRVCWVYYIAADDVFCIFIGLMTSTPRAPTFHDFAFVVRAFVVLGSQSCNVLLTLEWRTIANTRHIVTIIPSKY